ncbi:MAG: ATP-binding cassette domain-containing protein, partial [Myxococcota bacterium]
MAAVVTASRVCVHYAGAREPVLDGVDFRVVGGEAVAITGVSGSGKSTLLTHLAGLRRPQRGEIEVLGVHVHGASAERSASRAEVDALLADHVSVVFQRARLLPHLSV